MVFSYNWLQSFFQKKLPQPEKLAEILTMRFAEVEEVHPVKSLPSKGAEGAFNRVKKESQDFTLNIDIRPNRASDCFSHLGIAREIAAILGYKLKAPAFVSLKSGTTAGKKNFISVEVKNKTACPRYTARVINDVKVGSSPKWLKDRLRVCGLRPINNIVDITNYVMLETGQPLHAFDGDKLANKKIIVRFAKKGEKIITLDEEKYDLDDDVLVIADNKNPAAIAGIKGGKLPEIDKKTKIVVLESANFNPQIVRKGSKKLNLKTDASLRFEHGLDPNLTELAINRVAFLIQKLAKGKIAEEMIDVYPERVLPKKIRLDLDYVESLLGVKIPEKEIRNILKSLGFKIENWRAKRGVSSSPSLLQVETRKLKILNVVVPTFRLDVSIPEDLIEEIGRIYGYDKIPAIFPVGSLVPPKRNLDIFWEDFSKNILKETGFTEVYNYSFVGEETLKIFGYKTKELVEVENPISAEQKYLRPSLIPNLLKNLAKNFRHFQKFRIFELGKIFKTPAMEKRRLSGLILGEEFYYLKGVIDLLLNKLGISDIWYDEYQPTPEDSKQFIWHAKKCAEIKIGSVEIGFLGEVSPKILSSFDVKERIVLFDIDFEKLSKLASEEHEYRPISKFPSAVRDIAVLVPRNIRVSQVLNKIYTAGGKIIRDVDLFDIYEGEELPAGKKNLAFHIIYQAEDRTLSSKEIDKLQNEIIKNLEKEPDWQVRK